MDPWYDFLALPVAPLLIALQALALTWPGRRGMIVSVVCCAAVASMFALVTLLLPLVTPSHGANIGGGLLLVELIISVALVLGATPSTPAGRRDAPGERALGS